MLKATGIARAVLSAIWVSVLLWSGVALAEDNRLLTVEIQGEAGEEARIVDLRLEDLKALPERSFGTSTNWTSGVQSFTGVPLSALLADLGVTDGQMEMIAINEYSTFVEVADPTNEGALIAYLMNGETMTPRGKGPLWLVYDYDSDERYQTETIYSRSIWQLDRIVISR